MTVYVLTDYTRRPTVAHLPDCVSGEPLSTVALCHHLTVEREDAHAQWWAEWHPKAAPIDYAALPKCRSCERRRDVVA